MKKKNFLYEKESYLNVLIFKNQNKLCDANAIFQNENCSWLQNANEHCSLIISKSDTVYKKTKLK